MNEYSLFYMKLVHVTLIHKTLKYAGLSKKFQYFDKEVCRKVRRLPENIYMWLTSICHVSDMKLCNIINANISRASTYLPFYTIVWCQLTETFFQCSSRYLYVHIISESGYTYISKANIKELDIIVYRT
jgi:hypothetical protein